jgi:hypothetical protein
LGLNMNWIFIYAGRCSATGNRIADEVRCPVRPELNGAPISLVAEAARLSQDMDRSVVSETLARSATLQPTTMKRVILAPVRPELALPRSTPQRLKRNRPHP